MESETMPTLLEGIAAKYQDKEFDDEYGFIVFISNSPESKRGMLPPIMSLCEQDIERVGCSTDGISASKLTHVTELDLTQNSFSKWSEVLQILVTFPSLTFLNLSQNQLSERLEIPDVEQVCTRSLPLRKLIVNSNKVGWKSLNSLTRAMPFLEELHVSSNGLKNPEKGQFGHNNLRTLFLTHNSIDSFEAVQEHLECPNLEVLSMAECPLTQVPELAPGSPALARLTALNVNFTKISTWDDVDNFKTFPSLAELRMRSCPLLDELTAHERRSLLVARLPGISILNGGDKIPQNEREDAERAFIRYHLDDVAKPNRYHELVAVHGQLDPLVNVSMKPDTHVRVTISAHDEQEVREEVVSVYQTVAQLKSQLQQWFHIPVQNMRLYYCDHVLVKVTGPEELKWPLKELYTYNVRDGDSFIVDEKVPLTKLKTNSSKGSSHSSASPKPQGNSPVFPSVQRKAITMAAIDPKTFSNARGSPNPCKNSSRTSSQSLRSGATQVARNLFGTNTSQLPADAPDSNESNNNVKKVKEFQKHHSAGT